MVCRRGLQASRNSRWKLIVDTKDKIDIRLEILRLCMESSSLKVQENPLQKAEELFEWVMQPSQHKPKKKVVDEVIST